MTELELLKRAFVRIGEESVSARCLCDVLIAEKELADAKARRDKFLRDLADRREIEATMDDVKMAYQLSDLLEGLNNSDDIRRVFGFEEKSFYECLTALTTSTDED